MNGRLFHVTYTSFHNDDALHNDAFIVVPEGAEVWPCVKQAAGGIIPEIFTEIDEKGNVLDGEYQPGVVSYHEVEVAGWKIVAHPVETQCQRESAGTRQTR